MDLGRITELGFEKSSLWKGLVLVVSFSLWWNIFIVVQCYMVCILCSFMLAYRLQSPTLVYMRYFMDFCYFIEVIFVLVYRFSSKLNKLRYNKARRWFLIMLDIISVLPLEWIYAFYVVADQKQPLTPLLLIQNRLLRVYRIFQLESFYGITVRKTKQYTILLFVQIASKALLIAHFLTCIWVNVKHSVDCDGKVVSCYVWYSTNMAGLVIHNWSGPMEMFREPWERVLVVVAIFFGFLLIYCLFYPFTLYMFMQNTRKRAFYYDKYGKLQCYLHNMVRSPELKEKVLNCFNYIWKKDSEDSNLDVLLSNIPLALRKEIFTDIYWDAFRHSELLREVSRSCKRSLSLFMQTEYYQSGEVIYMKEQEKTKMMYLVQGIVQIMAEENEESPVLSFSGGTVFGELSLFLYTRSQAIVKCKSYCEFQILSTQAAAAVLRNYPRDSKIISRNFRERLLMARYTQWRKQKFGKLKNTDIISDMSTLTIQDCVKWIKTQWRILWEGHKRYRQIVKAREEGIRLPSWHGRFKPEIKIDYISNYLDLIVLSDIFEEKKDAVCLRTTFPWSIDPSAHFLQIWRYLIVVLALIPGLLYPLCTMWCHRFPWSVYMVSFIITWVFLIDVALKLLTAIKTKHKIITQFSGILFHRLQHFTFYLDVLAALPYQIYLVMNVDIEKVDPHLVGLVLHPAILKSYVFISLKVPLSDQMDIWTVLKNCMICILLVYWFAEIIQLTTVVTSHAKMWVPDKYDQNVWSKEVTCIFRALVTAISIPDYFQYKEGSVITICFWCAKYFFFFFFCFFLGDFYTVYTVKIFAQETFQVLLTRIQRFIHSIFISATVAGRLMRTLKFQWNYDKADYLLSKVPVIKSIPVILRQKIYSETTFRTLKNCGMFQEESEEFISDIMERSFLIAVPSGSVLVSCGHTSHSISVLHRGYCQINSFVVTDVTSGLGFSHTVGPTAMFPLLSSFSYVPAPVSVITITDCEVIMIDLNDLLSIMIKHNFLKDVIDVVKEEKLMDKLKHIPAMIRLNKAIVHKELQKEAYKAAFRFPCGKFLYFLCPKEKNFCNRKFLRVWEIIYVTYIILMCWIWPCCFGILIYASHIIVPILVIGKILILLQIIFQFYTPYYNEKGVLVTHPLYTSFNYLTTTFFLDFVCVWPIYSIYLYFYADPYKKPSLVMILINFLQYYIKLIHVMGFIKNMEEFVSNKHTLRICKTLLIITLIFNMFVNIVMFCNATWIYGGPYQVVGFELRHSFGSKSNKNLLQKNSIHDYFMFVSYWALCNLTTNDYFFQQPTGNAVYISIITSFVGTITFFYLYVWVSSNSIFKNIRGTLYQEKITSFVEYLKNEKADDKLIEYTISHFNQEHLRTQGENLNKIFQHLPLHLHEELVYPLYRPTFGKNSVFSQADEGFFKILAMHVTNVFYNRGSVIIFEKEALSDLFILHKGKCFVYDWFEILDVGSIMGDIKQTGLMENKIYALTHVELLKISSDDFFTIINGFYNLEVQFMYSVKNAENFLKSETQRAGYALRPVDSHDVLNAFGLQNRDIGFEDESFFEDPDNASSSFLKSWKYKQEERLRFLKIYPGTWKMKFYHSLALVTAFLTLIVIPTLLSFGSLTKDAFIAVGALDLLWFFYILAKFRMCYVDKVKGDVIADFKFIAKQYAKSVDGLTLDLLALIPFEFIPIILAESFTQVDATVVSWLRCIRLLRIYCLIRTFRGQSQNLNVNMYIKFLGVLFFIITWLTILVNTFFQIATEPLIVKARDPHVLDKQQFLALTLVTEYVINFIASANVAVLVPDTMSQIWFFNLNTFVSLYAKGWIIGQMLSVFYTRGLANSYYKSQVTALETYLTEKETSPSIINEVLNYKLNLLLFSRSEVMPSFLRKTPTMLRIAIMRDLYMHHLRNCPLFRGVEHVFLEQLIVRTKREIFFPGQNIVEQGDVDHCMYFIHSGEIYVISPTKERAYVEYVIGRMGAEESFGEAQGLWFSIPHSHSFRARTLVQVLVLYCNDWMDLRRSFPQIATGILNTAKTLRYI